MLYKIASLLVLCLGSAASCAELPRDAYGLMAAGAVSAKSAPAAALEVSSTATDSPKTASIESDTVVGPWGALLQCKQAQDWQLSDPRLTADLAWALYNVPGEQIFKVRSAVTPEWRKWRDAGDQGHAAYMALIARIEKELDKKGDMYAGSQKSAFAAFVATGDPHMDVEAFKKQFVRGVMLDKNSSYLFLLCAGLGYPGFDDVITRQLGGVDVSDKQTLARLLAMIIVSYRKNYEKKYMLSVQHKFDQFFSTRPGERVDGETGWFTQGVMRETPGSVSPDARPTNSLVWQRLQDEAAQEAHQAAAAALLNGLAKLKMAIVFLSARLEALRVPDKAFAYPDERNASADFLKDADFYSIILGCLSRLTERFLYEQEDTPHSSDYQAALVAEFRDQKTKRPLAGLFRLPAGERPARGDQKVSGNEIALQRLAFEARASIFLGDVDFFDYELPAASDASGSGERERMARDAKLYTALVRTQARFNGQSWGLIAKAPEEGLLKSFFALVRGLQAVAHEYGVDISRQAKMKESFKNMVATGLGHEAERKKITTNAPLFFAHKKRRNPAGGVILSVDDAGLKRLYHLLWLFVATRATRLFLSFKMNSDRSAAAMESSPEDAQTLLSDETLAQVVRPDGLPGKEMTVMQKTLARIADTAKRAGRRIEDAKRSVVSDQDLDGFIDGIEGSIGDARALVSGMSEVTRVVAQELENGYSRMQATLKALSVYVDSVVVFADKKIQGIQNTVRGFKDSMIKTLGAGVITKQLRKAFTGKNVDDDLAVANIKRHMDNIMLATKGQLRADQIKTVAPTPRASAMTSYGLAEAA